MYEIIFHILGLAILEIIFYFEYVGPMETIVFNRSIRNALNSAVNNIDNDEKAILKELFHNDQIQNIFFGSKNSTQYMSDVDNLYKNSINDRNKYNNKLFETCLIYWCIFFSSFMLFIILIKLIYILYKKNRDDDNIDNNESIEMIDTRNVISYNNVNMPTESSSNIENFDIVTNQENSIYRIQFGIKDFIKNYSKQIKITIYYILSFGGILLFEYFFFNKVVLKYKITSNDEIKYMIIEEFKPYID